MGATQIARALQGFNSSKAGSKVWTDEEQAARPGRLLRVEGLLRAVTEEFHRQDDTDADPEFVVRLLLRQAASWHQQHVHAQQRVRFFILKLAKFRRDYKKTWQRFPDFDMAEYQAALPRRFATFSPLEISARTARTAAIAAGQNAQAAQKAYDDCEDINDDLTFDEWRQAIVDFDEEWQEQRGTGPPTSTDNNNARQRVQALFDSHHALTANMAIGLAGATEPPPRRAGRTGRSARQVAAPVVPPQGAGSASDTGQRGHAAGASAAAANTAIVAAVAANKTATKEHYRAQAKRIVAAVTAAAAKQAATQQAETDAAVAANAALRQRVADVEASGAGALAHEQRTRDRRVVDLQNQVHELQARHAQT